MANSRTRWFIILGSTLLITSLFFYTINYLIFRDPEFIGKYVMAQLGFLPINVFLVTFVINKLIGSREKTNKKIKMNMIVGTFFIDIGHELLSRIISRSTVDIHAKEKFNLSPSWKEKDLQQFKTEVEGMKYDIHFSGEDLEALRDFLTPKRHHLVRLLESPVLTEHETFSNQLWAVLHIENELERRKNLQNLSQADHRHLMQDIERAYRLLAALYIEYLGYLKNQYPYLFSLEARTSPFNPRAQAEIPNEQEPELKT